MPENAYTPPRSILGGSTFAHRREEIFKRLKNSTEKCKENYSNRKELANDKNEIVAELCDSLDEVLSYGLKQHGNFVVTAASLFQNMQEIVTGNSGSASSVNETSFWDFSQNHMTSHERQRFENLKNVWTKAGRGRAFIRAALNENSLQRYILTWLSDTNKDLLERYYTPWSLLLDEEVAKQLPKIIGSLNKIFFALTVDAIELNRATQTCSVTPKEEPIIYAPAPVPVGSLKSKRKTNPIERPIATASSKEDYIKNLTLATKAKTSTENTNVDLYTEAYGISELPAELGQVTVLTPFDPIEPELEFLKQPLPDVYPENQTVLHMANSTSRENSIFKLDLSSDPDCEDKSDSSSQYSKSSSVHDSNCAMLEEKLRELNERYAFLETRVAQLSLENRQIVRRLTRHFNESGIDPNSSFATNFLITIPTVKLIHPKQVTSSCYYVYEVHITMRHHLEHWSVLRRYREFYKLHKTLLRTHPFIAAVEFPPKKHFGNKNLVFVEERRQQLQIYLLNLVESLPQVETCKTRAELQRVFPFLRDR